MRGGPAFAQVLEDKLRELSAADVAATGSPEKHSRPLPGHSARFANPFLFAAPYARVYAPIVAAPERRVDGFRRRALNPSEEGALAGLNRLGACLPADYSARDLRRAFRRLARQYHPDRHPTSDAAQHARLSQVFSSITDHHRKLAAALERQPLAAA